MIYVVSRTITLASIALISTIAMIFIFDYWFHISTDLYAFEYVFIMFGIDSIVNIICANLQYPQGQEMYEKLKCTNLDRLTQKYIIWCYQKNWSRLQCLLSPRCSFCRGLINHSDHSKHVAKEDTVSSDGSDLHDNVGA